MVVYNENIREYMGKLIHFRKLAIYKSILKIVNLGVPMVVQWLTNLTGNHEVAGSIPALAKWVDNPALP